MPKRTGLTTKQLRSKFMNAKARGKVVKIYLVWPSGPDLIQRIEIDGNTIEFIKDSIHSFDMIRWTRPRGGNLFLKNRSNPVFGNYWLAYGYLQRLKSQAKKVD